MTNTIVAIGIFAVNLVVILLDKHEYINLVQTIDMVLIPLVGGMMPVATTINNQPSEMGKPDEPE